MESIDKNTVIIKKQGRNKKSSKIVSKITKINLNKFRQFENKEFNIAPYLTILSGFNGTGKSTLLAILANSCELKNFKTLKNSTFRADISDILKGSMEYDQSASNVFSIDFLDEQNRPFTVPFRISWQDNKTRFRLISKQPTPDKSESKVIFPVIYLGLSRLYPLGECTYKEKISSENHIEKYFKNNIKERNWFFNKYKYILSIEDITNISAYKHPDLKQKCYIGINGTSYDAKTNSAGLDNLGQILLHLASFRLLRNEFLKEQKTWYGGLFLIDELDATMHPAAQIRLLNVLYEEAKLLNLQIVFTTHSLSLIKEFYNNRKYKNNNDNILYYLTNRNIDLEILQSPNYELIENDMLVTDPATIKNKSIDVLTEDDEAFWFAKQIIPDRLLEKINLKSANLGCESLVKLNEDTYPALKKILLLLDGDYTIDNKYKKRLNLLCLPGGKSPEGVLYEFLRKLPSDHYILNNETNLSQRTLSSFGPFSEKYNDQKKDREKYKKWFKDNKSVLVRLDIIKYWKNDNSLLLEKFIQELEYKINILSKIDNK